MTIMYVTTVDAYWNKGITSFRTLEMYVFSRTYMNNGIFDLFLHKTIVDVIAFQKNISRFKAVVFTYFTQNQIL
jgi:hypothetical protein